MTSMDPIDVIELLAVSLNYTYTPFGEYLRFSSSCAQLLTKRQAQIAISTTDRNAAKVKVDMKSLKMFVNFGDFCFYRGKWSVLGF